MNHFIILSFSFLILLVGCSGEEKDTKSAEETCKEKGEDYVYVKAEGESEGKCLTKDEKQCVDRGDEYVYDEENNTCTKPASPEEACKLKASQGYKWENNQCVQQAKYTILFKSSQEGSNGHVVSVDSGSGLLRKLLQNVNECAVVTENQAKTLKISAGDLSAPKVLCDHASSLEYLKCKLKNYEVSYNLKTTGGPGGRNQVIGYELKEVESASENCNPLESTQ